ncbi:MAG: hypothetical protein ACRDKG_11545 [Actinomycetota bacterium]
MRSEKDEILATESDDWSQIHRLIDSLSPEQAAKPSYYPEGWSAKDALGHIGAWLAEAGMVLEQIYAGSYRPDEIDIDAMNAKFLEAMRDVPFDGIRAQAMAARTRMLRALSALPEVTEEALQWVRKSGSDHYREHLARLREWVEELRA